MRRIFLDTGYLIALEASDDQNHRSAQIYWQELTRRLPLLVTTSYVFDEVVTFFNSRGHHSKAVDIGERLLDSPSVRLVHVDEGLFRAAWNYFQKRRDKRYSLTDSVSFVVMEREGIREALTFDTHFEQAGFVRQPASANP